MQNEKKLKVVVKIKEFFLRLLTVLKKLITTPHSSAVASVCKWFRGLDVSTSVSIIDLITSIILLLISIVGATFILIIMYVGF